jgi:protein-tyrosine phosphatase
MNYVDLHLHILPGLDDGSKNVNESVAMGQALVKLGFVRAAPSPHHRSEYASRDATKCAQALSELNAVFKTHNIDLPLETNAENFFLDESLMAELSTPARRTFGKKFLLIEAPYQGPLPMLKDIIFKMKLKGVSPVIAHPERCFEFEKKGRAAEIKEAGAYLQLDIGALTGRYGKTAQKLAKEFLDQGLYSIGATDLHSPVGAVDWISESIELISKQVGKTQLDLLLSKNPNSMLNGNDPVDVKHPPR